MSINLIPPKIKQERKLNKTLYEAVLGFWIIFACTIIFASAIYFYNSSLSSSLQSWQEKIDDQKTKNKPLAETESKIQKLNNKLIKIDNLITSRTNWSTVLESIASATPKNIQVTNLNLDRASGQIAIQGIATTRTDIAFMKEKLEENDKFSTVTFSTSSFNEQTNDYNFNLNMNLNQKK